MYVREIESQKLTLRVSGKLWMRSLVMSDVETETEWSHLLGRAMAGPLKDQELTPVVSDMLTWSAWREEHPDTTVLDLSRTRKNYSRDFYRDPNRFVFGFDVGGKSFALPMDKLLVRPVQTFAVADRWLVATFDKSSTACRLFDAELDGRQLEFAPLDDRTMRDAETGSRWEIASATAVDGVMEGSQLKQVVGIMSFRKAWQNFHPASTDVEFTPSTSSESSASQSSDNESGD